MHSKRILTSGLAILTSCTLMGTTSICSMNADSTHDRLLAAICTVESNCNDDAVGDGGDSIGAYQIQYAYWKDATDFDKSIGGSYQDCKNSEYSRKIVLAYWSRYATITRVGEEVTDEDRARIHNGGPNGYKKNSTEKYWTKVKAVLTSTERRQ